MVCFLEWSSSLLYNLYIFIKLLCVHVLDRKPNHWLSGGQYLVSCRRVEVVSHKKLMTDSKNKIKVESHNHALQAFIAIVTQHLHAKGRIDHGNCEAPKWKCESKINKLNNIYSNFIWPSYIIVLRNKVIIALHFSQ